MYNLNIIISGDIVSFKSINVSWVNMLINIHNNKKDIVNCRNNPQDRIELYIYIYIGLIY